MKHVIIGAGAAGISAAKTIRRLQQNDEIVVISTDKTVCSRCMLHKFIGKERNEAGLSFVEPSFFEDKNIVWHSGTTVTSVDFTAKQVQIGNEAIPYDKLLIATGANSAVPPIGDLRTAGNVYGLRHLSDAKKISEKAETAEKAVIIGAGLVGLDAAYALIHLKKQVTVVEMATQILPLNLDATAAGAYQTLFEQNGGNFRLGTKVVATQTNAEGNISAIVLESGEELPCDMVIVAAGVRPALEFLQDSGIAIERSVVVNERLETNIQDVYAAGDITGLGEIWPSAVRQGEVAAYNMCGEKDEFTDRFALKNTINFYNLPTLSVGDAQQKNGGDAHIKMRPGQYEKIVVQGNYVTGVIKQGDISNTGIWQYLVKNKIDISTKNKPVWKLTFADFYDTDIDGQYVWNE